MHVSDIGETFFRFHANFQWLSCIPRVFRARGSIAHHQCGPMWNMARVGGFLGCGKFGRIVEIIEIQYLHITALRGNYVSYHCYTRFIGLMFPYRP